MRLLWEKGSKALKPEKLIPQGVWRSLGRRDFQKIKGGPPVNSGKQRVQALPLLRCEPFANDRKGALRGPLQGAVGDGLKHVRGRDLQPAFPKPFDQRRDKDRYVAFLLGQIGLQPCLYGIGVFARDGRKSEEASYGGDDMTFFRPLD